MTTEEMIDRLVPDIADEMNGLTLQEFLEYYIRQELEDQTPEAIKKQYADMYNE